MKIGGTTMRTSNSQLRLAALGLMACSALVLGHRAAYANSDETGHMDMGAHHHHANNSGFAFGAPAPAAQATRTVGIDMGLISFQPTEVTVRTGEVVHFVVTNTSKVDHEFTLGDAAAEQAHRKEMIDMMAHGASMQHSDPNAISVKAGESRDLTWKFSRAGQFEYDCNVPGHYEAGMKGIIAVR